MPQKTFTIRFTEEEFEDFESLTLTEGYPSKSDMLRQLIRNKWDEWAARLEKEYEQNPDEWETLEDFQKSISSEK